MRTFPLPILLSVVAIGLVTIRTTDAQDAGTPFPTVPTADTGTTTESGALLGVAIQEVTQEVATSMGLDKPRGALVHSVTPDSPAARAGVRIGDVILEFNRKRIERVSELPPLVKTSRPGTSVLLLVRRDKQSLFVSATLTASRK